MSFGPHPAARAADEISQRLDHHHQLVDRLGHRQDPEAVQTQQRLRQPVPSLIVRGSSPLCLRQQQRWRDL